MKNNKKFIILGMIASLVFAVVISTNTASATTFSQITGNTTLTVGSRGSDVKAMQQFLASNSDMYPTGLTTGYFGSLSKAAAIQFQLAYNLSADGIVGPMTRAKMNNIMSAGYGIDVYAPSIVNLSVNTSGRNASLSFSSNEPVKAAVFYDTSPINWNNWDDSVMSLDTPAISGTASTDNTFSTNKQFSLSNLLPNTTYYYVVTDTDQSGNTSTIWPTTLRTAQ